MSISSQLIYAIRETNSDLFFTGKNKPLSNINPKLYNTVRGVKMALRRIDKSKFVVVAISLTEVGIMDDEDLNRK